MRRILNLIAAVVFMFVGIVFMWSYFEGASESGTRGEAAQLTQAIISVFGFLLAAVFGWRGMSGKVGQAKNDPNEPEENEE